MSWPKHPVIYEINTWVWLHEISQRLGRPVTLGSVPAEDMGCARWNFRRMPSG